MSPTPRSHPLLAGLLLLCACSGDGGPSNTTVDGIVPPVDDGIDVPTADTVIGGSFIDATYFLVTARFAYDESSQQFSSYAHPDDGLQPMSVSVLLVDSDAALTGTVDATNSCFVTMELEGSVSNAPWVEEQEAWAGFDLPAGTTVRDNCRSYGLPSEWGGDVASHVTKWRWSVGVGPLNDETRSTLEQQLPASEWAALQPFVVGGVTLSDLFSLTGLAGDDGYLDLGIGLGFEVDSSFQIEIGGTGNYLPIEAQSINAPGGIATGYYEIEVGLFEPATVLTNPVP
ncbi:MAG TPA: hypothetical protein ENK18_21755 [Deltaproteobacteria bacterium]|nr:hypothetical protein [Deltaproteobacteria bacterium]